MPLRYIYSADIPIDLDTLWLMRALIAQALTSGKLDTAFQKFVCTDESEF